MKKRSKNKKSQNHETRLTLSDEVVGLCASREVVDDATLFGRLEAGIGAAAIFFERGGGDLATTASS
jgi:hypothetical protein